MGQQDIREGLEGEPLRHFHKRLLDDLYALERMLEEGLFDTDVRRMGAEQELFLADQAGHPHTTALDLLKRVDDPHFTTELALFNLEINLDPVPLEGHGLSRMEAQLGELISKVRAAASEIGTDIVMTGILPSLRRSDMRLENMTPLPRYEALNRSVQALRGGPLDFRIRGVDELLLKHDSVMLESCNASFQVHLQVGPDEFARLYNAAQAYAAPQLAMATNAPLLFGKRLWQETRIALFQQATDTRHAERETEMPARGHFGRRWLRGSVVDLFKEDIARFRAILGTVKDEDPLDMLRNGHLPHLRALCLHNGTIWRWNRPCYGITEGRPHLRIENRILPSGPSILDEMANAAFWLGLMFSSSTQSTDFADRLDFEVVHENFIAAARQGLNAQLTWVSGDTVPAQTLIKEELIPQSRAGLLMAGIDKLDIDRYLGVVSERVSSGRTGSRWLLLSLGEMKNTGTATERLSALTRATIYRQIDGEPVHEWSPADLKEAGGWKRHYMHVEQYMTTDLSIAREDDSLELVANRMDWEKIRHILVEDRDRRLVGLVSYRSILRALARGERDGASRSIPVSRIMKREPLTIPPETPTLEAIDMMRTKNVGCLPVVRDGRLLGIVTERDFMVLTRELLVQKLRE